MFLLHLSWAVCSEISIGSSGPEKTPAGVIPFGDRMAARVGQGFMVRRDVQRANDRGSGKWPRAYKAILQQTVFRNSLGPNKSWRINRCAAIQQTIRSWVAGAPAESKGLRILRAAATPAVRHDRPGKKTFLVRPKNNGSRIAAPARMAKPPAGFPEAATKRSRVEFRQLVSE